MNTRAVAATVIHDVMMGSSLTDSLHHRLQNVKNSQDKAFIQALSFGTCRFYTRLSIALDCLLKRSLPKKEKLIEALLLIGLYQLMEMNTSSHAAVAETVSATTTLKKPWAKGLVNAILREYLRQSDAINTAISKNKEAYYAHPAWWIESIQRAFPSHYEAILTANNEHPPLTLRINSKQISRAAYSKVLDDEGLSHQLSLITPLALTLSSPVPVEKIPYFSNGWVSIQDEAAQLAATLLQVEKHHQVLDACAAPGGKLTHLLELTPSAKVIAIEQEASRMLPIQQNLARLQLSATILCEDAADTKKWWDGKLFDRILLDAPCSGSGVIRRHPDIKLLRRPEDITQFAAKQRRLLSALWPLLRPDGLLLYVTCSIFPKENTDITRDFLSTHNDAKEEIIDATWGVASEIGRQILPGMKGMDGFYYARFRKIE